MNIPKEDLFQVLRQYNPWWAGDRKPETVAWRRAAFYELWEWLWIPPSRRAIVLTGARQIGKTTLFLQAIARLLEKGVPPQNILYATYDHPFLKLFGLEKLLELWRELETARDGPEFIFLDEVQFTKHWQTWVKHQVDFSGKERRIALTGSATPLTEFGQESGVGRWVTLKLHTLSFFEFLQITGKEVARQPATRVDSLSDFFDWTDRQRQDAGMAFQELTGFFHEYLVRGGFPEIALIENLDRAQKLLREDIVDKVLKRDMTALFGVRHVLEVEQLFLYLCMYDSGLLDVRKICENLEMTKPTVLKFLDLLESAHLIFKLLPYGYGREVLRGKSKIYIADPSIAPAVLMKGKSLLEDATALGRAVETAAYKHLRTHFDRQSAIFGYYRGRKDREVDLIATVAGKSIPFEIKYTDKLNAGNLKGLADFCDEKKPERGYVFARSWRDFRVVSIGQTKTPILQIPAPLALFVLGGMETGARESEN